MEKGKVQKPKADKLELIAKWKEICDIGERRIVSSFLSVSKDTINFGVLNLPDAFLDRFGTDLPPRIGLKCHKTLWCVKYDMERKEIYGLNKFMRFYGLRIFHLVQFDYYGEGLFVVSILKDTGLECNYPTDNPNELEVSKEWETVNKDEYVIDPTTLEYEKGITSIMFNACYNKSPFADLIFSLSDLDPYLGIMGLAPTWEHFYKDWIDGSKVSLQLLNTTWEINIQKINEMCYFSRGWIEFVHEVGLREGDHLVAYREYTNDLNRLKVCIYKGESYSPIDETDRWGKSFFKIVYEDACEKGILRVPYLVNELYGRKLRGVQKISVGGMEWIFKYKQRLGYIYNLEEIFRKYSVKPMDTIILTFNENNVIYGRIYNDFGMEIEYQGQRYEHNESSYATCIWDFKDITKKDEVSEMNGIVEIAANSDATKEFITTLTPVHVDNKTHGVTIPATIKPLKGKWKKRQPIKLITEKGVWDIGIVASGASARFCAGWNRFIRENEYSAGQSLTFKMTENGELIQFEIATSPAT